MHYCFECGEYPCEKYDGINQHDSIMLHKNQLTDIEKAKTIGIEKYNQQQTQKVEILHKLLQNYNYGQDKEIFFCTAVNILPLENLVSITENLDKNTQNMTLEEKYNHVKRKLFECAHAHNIKIELRKGKYNKEKITFD